MTIDPGHKLSSDGISENLSSVELRQRRLAALEKTSVALLGNPPAAPSSSLLVDEDEDLQAAIASSLYTSNEAAVAAVSEQHATTPSAAGSNESGAPSTQDSFQVFSFHDVMWDSVTTTDNDKMRWIQQGIDLQSRNNSDNIDSTTAPPGSDSMLTLVGAHHGPWGLVQNHGGPCGVLAAVQAELLRILLFGKRNPLEYPTEMEKDQVWAPTSSMASDDHHLVSQALAMSIAIIIARATLMPAASDEDQDIAISSNTSARLVLPAMPQDDDDDYTGLSWQHLYPDDATNNTNLQVHTITPSPISPLKSNPSKRQKMQQENPQGDSNDWLLPRQARITHLAHAITDFLLKNNTLEYYRKPGGVLLLTMALVASRGNVVVTKDFDDASSKLTSQFGHCSQELMNLLLTGQAVSNVFDNTLTPSGGGLTLRGIQSRPAVGYLSQLEALRYCEVGSFYKSPQFPLWVVGSTSHFTVIFGEASCLKESKSDVLLEKCRRAFKSIEGAEENGYIPTDSLKKVFGRLDLKVGDDALFPVLTAMLEMDGGAGIVVWDEFWKVASRLLSGATLESVLQRGESGESMPPLLLTNGEIDEDDDKKPAAAAAKKPSVTFQDKPSIAFAAPIPPIQMFMEEPASAIGMETDEEMARRLAQEWGANELNSPAPPAAAAAARPSSPMEMDTTTAMSADEQLARKLQAEAWEESGGASSVAAVTDSPPHLEAIGLLKGDEGDTALLKGEDILDAKMPAKQLEFETFGNSFRLFHYNGMRGGSLTPFRVTRLTAEEAVGASVPLTNAAGNKGVGAATGDLEDVLRTKWPSCEIDWLGASSSPSID